MPIYAVYTFSGGVPSPTVDGEIDIYDDSGDQSNLIETRNFTPNISALIDEGWRWTNPAITHPLFLDYIWGLIDASRINNDLGFISSISSGDVTTALGYTPVNPDGTNLQYIAGDGSKVTFPAIPAAQVKSDWNSVSGVSEILNKPTIPSTTSHISEGTNLYYTDARARASVSLTTTGSGVATYNNTSGVLNIPTPSTDKRIEVYSGTTDASGNYTVNYSSSFSSVPYVNAVITNPTTQQQVRLTSSSTTGFTVNATNRATVTLLATDLLLGTTTPLSGATVKVVVIGN